MNAQYPHNRSILEGPDVCLECTESRYLRLGMFCLGFAVVELRGQEDPGLLVYPKDPKSSVPIGGGYLPKP